MLPAGHDPSHFGDAPEIGPDQGGGWGAIGSSAEDGVDYADGDDDGDGAAGERGQSGEEDELRWRFGVHRAVRVKGAVRI